MKYSKINSIVGFTLVELIVVITIVGILSTVGFVSYSGYLSGARDSNRISQLTKLSDSLQVYSASKSLPLPDNAIEITASGTLIAYQGEVGVDVLETIDYTNGGTDPKDDSYYTYYLTKDRNSLQLMALMEEAQSVSYQFPNTPTNLTTQVHANFEDRFPKVYGRKLGVLTYSDAANPELLNTPANQISANTLAGELDIVQTTTTYTANISDDTGSKITGTGGVLMESVPNGSCRRIKQTGGSDGNGIYTISLVGTDFQVYCDMETAGGGWTLLKKGVSGGVAYQDDVTNKESPYGFNYPTYDHLFPTSYMQATFNTGFDIVDYVEYSVYTDNINFNGFSAANVIGNNQIGDNGMLFSK